MDVGSWARLGRALAFYKDRGYQFIDVPWAVDKYTVSITCPSPDLASDVRGLGTLVGSAEQSFLRLELEGRLPPGKYVGCTPCFRIADAGRDRYHHPYFMKVELYRNDLGREPVVEVRQMLRDADHFFYDEMRRSQGLGAKRPHRVATHEGWDLEIGGIEVGSYGMRSHGDLYWGCGTGLAEPRFTQAIARSN